VLDPDLLSALIGMIYDAALDPAAWGSVLERMAVELVRNFAGLPSRRHQEAVCALVRTFAARCGEEAAEASPAGPPKS
jgi:hypothetical protein